MNADVVLCVDLDGTLIRTDMLHETAIRLLHVSPISVFQMPLWLLSGKAYLKKRIAEKSHFDPATLPYNAQLVAWLKKQKSDGRYIVLSTATDLHIANKIADYLGFFDEVLGSDGATNLAGKHKVTILVERFGLKGFDYVGNSSADLLVWEKARKAIVVNASKRVQMDASACATIEFSINDKPLSNFRSWVKAIRLHQWLKNTLLFIPLIAAHQWTSLSTWFLVMMAFLAFSLCASSVYLMNDLFDLDSDRAHIHKYKRPFASGDLALWKGALLVPAILIISLLIAKEVNTQFLSWLLVYFFLTFIYSMKLKQIVLVDCIVLAVLYTLRIVAGTTAAGLAISFWLLAFSIFLFLSLAFVKRFSELQVQLLHGKHKAIGRGYLTDDAPLIQMLGVASGLLSSLVLALYLNGENVVKLYHSPEWVWGCVPVMIFWISWMWLRAHRGEMHEDPLVFAVKDKASLFSGLFFCFFLVMGITL